MIEYGCGTLDASGRSLTLRRLLYLSTISCAPFSVSGLMYGFVPPVVGTVPSRRVRHFLVGAHNVHT